MRLPLIPFDRLRVSGKVLPFDRLRACPASCPLIACPVLDTGVSLSNQGGHTTVMRLPLIPFDRLRVSGKGVLLP